MNCWFSFLISQKLSSAKEQKPVSAKPQEVKVKYVERKITDEDVDILIDRYKTRRKAKKEAKQAEEKARKIVQTHYETAQPAQTYRSFDDFFWNGHYFFNFLLSIYMMYRINGHDSEIIYIV